MIKKSTISRKALALCVVALSATLAMTALGCSPEVDESSDATGANAEATSELVAYHQALGEDISTCDGAEGATGIDVPGYYSLDAEVCTTATRDYCMSCHADTWEHDVAALENYEDYGNYNPHDSHMGEIDCGTCHSLHGESVYICGSCHTNYEAPEGWTV